MAEQIFYTDERVQISNALVVVEGVNYATARIRAVSLEETAPDRKKGYALQVSGLLCLVIAGVPLILLLATLSDRTTIGALIFPFIFIGLTAFLALILLNGSRKSFKDKRPLFTVALDTQNGRISALSSKNQAYLQKIVGAIQQAIK